MADRWIVYDTVQYINKGWINRNRILHPKEGWFYIIAPVRKHPHDTSIMDVKIHDQTDWRRRIIGQLSHYKRKAPYYNNTIALVEDCLSLKESSISKFDVAVLDKVCSTLGIQFECEFYSEMSLDLGPVEEPGDAAMRKAEALGASEYINPPGGEKLFNMKRFSDTGIKLTIRRLPTFEYSPEGYQFIPDLSIIDLLMWNEPAEIKCYLDKYRDDR